MNAERRQTSEPGDGHQEQQERPPWMDVIERLAQPIKREVKRPRREWTRWQKPGPMARKDWIRFYRWAAKNAIAPHMRKVKKPVKKLDPREERRLRLAKKAGAVPLEERLKRTPDLAEPRNPREKFLFPYIPDFPYLPHIRLKYPPPFPEKGRPRIAALVPKSFQHWEIEADFWTKLRYQIHPSAMTYKASSNIKKLAVPRVVPPLVPHCLVPPKEPEIIPKRRKFTRSQWRRHKAKLASYLARPRPLFNIDDIIYLQEVQMRIKCGY